MKCFNCGKQSTSFYSPLELYKYRLLLCKECIKLLQQQDIRYIYQANNQEFAEKELKQLVKKRDSK